MSDTTSQFCLWLILIFSIFIPSSSAEQKNITAEPGQNVNLSCRAPNNNNNNNITVVEWSRPELKTEFVFVHRNERLDPENQHPSFKNRVNLEDKQMKDGDVSVMLKNVTINDTGTYECRVQRENGIMELISIINLSVAPPGHRGGLAEDGGKEDGGKEDGGKEDGEKEDGEKEDGGSAGLIVGLSVSGLLLVGGVGFLFYRRCRKQQGPDPKQLPDEHQLDCKSLDSQDCDLQTCKENLLKEVP